MADMGNSKLIGLLIITGMGSLLSQGHIKERRKQRQWVRSWISKGDNKVAYYSIINDLRLTDKEDFRKYCFCTVQVDTVYQKVLYNWCLVLFFRHGIQKTKEHILHKWGFIMFENVISLDIVKIFFTMLHLKIFLEYWIILHIFRISLCVTSPLENFKVFVFELFLLTLSWRRPLSYRNQLIDLLRKKDFIKKLIFMVKTFAPSECPSKFESISNTWTKCQTKLK